MNASMDGAGAPIIELQGVRQELRPRPVCSRGSTSRPIPERSPHWSATTAPASRRSSRASRACSRTTTAWVRFDGELGGTCTRLAMAGAARHRGGVPGSRAVRQPRHRAEHVPRPRGDRAGAMSTRGAWRRTPPTASARSRCALVKSVRQRVSQPLSGGQRQTVAIAMLGRAEEGAARDPRRADRGPGRREQYDARRRRKKIYVLLDEGNDRQRRRDPCRQDPRRRSTCARHAASSSKEAERVERALGLLPRQGGNPGRAGLQAPREIGLPAGQEVKVSHRS